MSGQEIWDMSHSLASQVENLEQVERDLHQKIRDILSWASITFTCHKCGDHVWVVQGFGKKDHRIYTEEGEIHAC